MHQPLQTEIYQNCRETQGNNRPYASSDIPTILAPVIVHMHIGKDTMLWKPKKGRYRIATDKGILYYTLAGAGFQPPAILSALMSLDIRCSEECTFRYLTSAVNRFRMSSPGVSNGSIPT